MPAVNDAVKLTEARRDNLLKIKTVLSRFKVVELQTYVYKHHCPQYNWADIVDRFQKREEPLRNKQLAHFFVKTLTQKGNNAVFELHETLTLLDLMLHSERKTWHLIILSEKENDAEVFMTKAEVKGAIEAEFTRRQIRVHVAVYRYKHQFWISIRKEKEVKGQRREPKTSEKYFMPTFFAIPINDPHLFTTTSEAKKQKEVYRAVAFALGYRRATYSSETGRAFEGVKRKHDWIQNYKVNHQPAADLPEPRIEPFPRSEKGSGGLDFTNYQSQANYLDCMFGPDPPKFERLEICDTKFIALDTNKKDADSWDDVKMRFSYTIKSDDAIRTFKKISLDDQIWPFPPPAAVLEKVFGVRNGSDEDDESD